MPDYTIIYVIFVGVTMLFGYMFWSEKKEKHKAREIEYQQLKQRVKQLEEEKS